MTCDEIEAVVREAIDHSRHLPHGQAERAIASRVADKLTHLTLSAPDRTTLEWLRALAACGVFEHATDSVCVEHTKRCRESISLIARLLGVTP